MPFCDYHKAVVTRLKLLQIFQIMDIHNLNSLCLTITFKKKCSNQSKAIIKFSGCYMCACICVCMCIHMNAQNTGLLSIYFPSQYLIKCYPIRYSFRTCQINKLHNTSQLPRLINYYKIRNWSPAIDADDAITDTWRITKYT